MPSIMTVLGPVAPEHLGVTSMHDHVLAVLAPFFQHQMTEVETATCPIDLNAGIRLENLCYLNRAGWRGSCPDNWDLADAALMQREVGYFKARGGSAILEPSAQGIRTNIQGVRDISKATAVHIIASTGLYVRDSWPARFHAMAQAEFRDYLRQEIHEGIDGTDIRAGHIKTAIRQGDDAEFRFVPTMAQVANESNLLVTAHTSYATSQDRREALLDAFLSHGMNPAKLLFCHLQFTFLRADPVEVLMNPGRHAINLDWAKRIMDHGAHICIDLFGSPSDAEDQMRLAGLLLLIRAGYGAQMVIGNDVYQRALTRTGGSFGYAGILDYAVPMLRQHGVDEKTIRDILVTNPARLLQH